MTKRTLEEQWGHLVSAFFEDLERDTKGAATVDGEANAVLLSELGWDLSKEKFEDPAKGKTVHLGILCATFAACGCCPRQHKHTTFTCVLNVDLLEKKPKKPCALS